jgi:hypothetical protein
MIHFIIQNTSVSLHSSIVSFGRVHDRLRRVDRRLIVKLRRLLLLLLRRRRSSVELLLHGRRRRSIRNCRIERHAIARIRGQSVFWTHRRTIRGRKRRIVDHCRLHHRRCAKEQTNLRRRKKREFVFTLSSWRHRRTLSGSASHLLRTLLVGSSNCGLMTPRVRVAIFATTANSNQNQQQHDSSHNADNDVNIAATCRSKKPTKQQQQQQQLEISQWKPGRRNACRRSSTRQNYCSCFSLKKTNKLLPSFPPSLPAAGDSFIASVIHVFRLRTLTYTPYDPGAPQIAWLPPVDVPVCTTPVK